MKKLKERFIIAKKEKITSSTKSTTPKRKLRPVDVKKMHPVKLVKY